MIAARPGKNTKIKAKRDCGKVSDKCNECDGLKWGENEWNIEVIER